jgi:hypothetical protein
MDKRVIFGLLTLTVIGGVGYYLYRESKKTEGATLRKGVDKVAPETRSEKIAKVKDTKKALYVGHEVATPIYLAPEENNGRANRNIYA